MPSKKSDSKITNREKDVLEVLWNSDTPLLASDIPKLNPSLSISSVQLSLRNLLSKNIIEVADIVHSGTVLSRSYRPLISIEDFISNEVINNYRNLDKAISTKNIVATLLKHEKNEANTIKELEKLLEERKKQLNQQNKIEKGV
ncbi:BlaI/MecI/CopY family transcriptional regulator [Candidatus Galacturonibacter soehngenii]|uniref:BlaI/MecI/CopY family transcriptional regulator n=1 Tax=Candidatus Galacturonatibacter soehngenii TaxID=2307010 RepID=A0A7V7QKP6_9FIRM|nr:BlaI/MecI/CopY family transcriptional regulator [Candidatus Galacturonibacter soehngenii]KAB1438031.1 BlaI/MecI/CopY family transcriptional regulator [Candidatus Galacturonibacter soehngenii]